MYLVLVRSVVDSAKPWNSSPCWKKAPSNGFYDLLRFFFRIFVPFSIGGWLLSGQYSPCRLQSGTTLLNYTRTSHLDFGATKCVIIPPVDLTLRGLAQHDVFPTYGWFIFIYRQVPPIWTPAGQAKGYFHRQL